MIIIIFVIIGVTLLAHNIAKQIKHDRMMKNFHEFMEIEFNSTFDKFTNECREYYETGDGKVLIEDFKKRDVEF